MILVDSSVWIDWFRGRATAQTIYLQSALQDGYSELVIGDLILLEVLQGFRSDQEAHTAESAFAALGCLELGGFELANAAAQNYRRLRQQGITIRSTVDCLIATFCIQHNITLLHNDRDFEPFEQHLGLQVIHAGG